MTGALEKVGQESQGDGEKNSLSNDPKRLPADLPQFSLVFDFLFVFTKFSRTARGKRYSGFIESLEVTDSGSREQKKQ